MPKRHIPTGASKRHRTSTQSANLQNQSLVKQLRQSANLQNQSLVKQLRSTNRWRKLSTLTRSRFPQCQHKDCIDLATSVHHIVSADIDPSLFFVGSNLISLCSYHHSLVSAMERRGEFEKAEKLYDYWHDVYQ